jgi:hypothetical protein
MSTVKLTGIDTNPTLLADSLTRGTDEGKPAKISDNKTAALAADGDEFYGTIQSISEDEAVCVIKNRGIITLPYTGTAPSVGYGDLVANGAGGVKKGAGTNQMFWIFDVDTTNGTVTFDLG